MDLVFRLGTGEDSGSSSVDGEKLKQLEKTVNSNTQRIQNLESEIKIVVMTQAEYDELGEYDDKTLYVLI